MLASKSRLRPQIRSSDTELKYPCWIEMQKDGTKIHIVYDGDDLDDALTRIDESLAVRAYAVNGFMAQIEKMEKGRK